MDMTTAPPRAKNPQKVRKRAPKACLSCRARKVRCDVSQRGRPCMNCYLDSETCVVTGRASRLRKSQKPEPIPYNNNNDNNDDNNNNNNTDNTGDTHAATPPKAFVSGDEVHKSHHSHDHDHDHGHSHHSHSHTSPHSQPVKSPPAESETHSHQTLRNSSVSDDTYHTSQADQARQARQAQQAQQAQQTETFQEALLTAPQPFGLAGSLGGSLGDFSGGLQQLSADITYSYYPFLAISNLSGILPQDVNYLELQGCLRVPTRAILDEFVQQYFLHVHPLLPLFNEGDFWELYCQQGGATGRISLLVFQALLFATCNFVSRNSIRALGFPTIRLGRAALYRRAKLLFDFETESSPAAIAQAALLLSFWSPVSSPGTKNPNTAWLCTAIQQAKLAEAHHYGALPPEQHKRALALKRLWWCCIIRDRVMGLGVRRSIQITRAHFDLDAHAPLSRADLADEIARSRVYNPGTKSCLIEILVAMVDLCVVLTDILTLVFPLDDTPGWGRQRSADDANVGADADGGDAGRVCQGKIELRRWYKDVALKFPMFGGGTHKHGTARLPPGEPKAFYHDSVILYTNLMYMYYHSSRVALCHHEVLHIAVANATLAGKASPAIYENRYELQDAASGVTECLKELIQLRLARWLPISAVACTALPLFLHILDVKLSSAPPESSPGDSSDASSSALKQHRLDILIEAMKTYQPQYDGVDWISETIRHIIKLAQLDGPVRPGAAGDGGGGTTPPITDWTDILASHPSWYLRLALTMDLALSKNRMPEERDFPVGLRGLFASGSDPIRSLGCKEPASSGERAPVAAAAAATDVSHLTTATTDCAPFLVTPQHLALSMSMAMGMDMHMDMDMDLVDMSMDVDLTGGHGSASRLSSSTLVVPSSDEEETSPSAPSEADHCSPAAQTGTFDKPQHAMIGSFGFGEVDPIASAPPVEGRPSHDNEWIEPAWEDDVVDLREGDRDTARALLEAMGDA